MPSPKIVLELKDVSQLAPQTSNAEDVSGKTKAPPAIVVAPAEGPPSSETAHHATEGGSKHHLSVDGGQVRRPSATPSSNLDRRRRTLRAQSVAIARKAAVNLKDSFPQVSP